MKSRITLADIGALAGVSSSTASMILSGREGVSFSEETIYRVRAAAAELGYSPSGGKRRPSGAFDRKTILIVCPNVLNPYYATLVQAIEQAARDTGYATLVYTTYRDEDNERRCLESAARNGLKGVIFTMMPQAVAEVERLDKTVPVVVIGDRNAGLGVDTVELDNYNAGTLVARHMISLGHRHIAYISTPLDAANSARLRRLEGVRDAYRRECPDGSVLVRSRDVSPDMELHTIPVEHDVGFELTKACLAGKRALTAFVAVNDMVAYGVLDAVRSAGFRVPEDYSVCGFDNIFPSAFPGISLTTVEHYIVDKGRNAFEILYGKISGTASDRNIVRVEFKHRLIVRNSTAAPRAVDVVRS